MQGAQSAQKGVAVVQALIDMAHTLQLSVVAEGVETTQQLDMLREMRCDELQGFLLARPQSPEELLNLLTPPAAIAKPKDLLHLGCLALPPRTV